MSHKFSDGLLDSADALSDPKTDLFKRGKQIIGASGGGQVNKLLKGCGGDIGKAGAILDLAATKADPREYIAGVVNGTGRSNRDLAGPRSPRDM